MLDFEKGVFAIMFENKTTKILVYLFVVTPLMITFMASPLIVQNEETKILMYVNWTSTATNSVDETASLLNCTWPTLKLIDSPGGPLTALASRPGSGNTWVRHLLQLATGIQTGSIFNELRLKRNGFPGEGITDGSVVAIKTHNLHS